MFMRFLGGGIGHRAHSSDLLAPDVDVADPINVSIGSTAEGATNHPQDDQDSSASETGEDDDEDLLSNGENESSLDLDDRHGGTEDDLLGDFEDGEGAMADFITM